MLKINFCEFNDDCNNNKRKTDELLMQMTRNIIIIIIKMVIKYRIFTYSACEQVLLVECTNNI